MKKSSMLLLALLGIVGMGCADRHRKSLPDETVAVIGGSDVATGIWIGNGEASHGGTTLEEQGLRLILQMSRLASDSAYMELCRPSEEINEMVGCIARQPVDVPGEVFAISNLRQALDLPEDASPLVADRLVGSIPLQLNASGGAETIAAASLLVVEDAFLYGEGLEEPLLYLYRYEGDWQVMVLFRPARDGVVVRANACFVRHAALNGVHTADEVKALFREVLDMDNVDIINMKRK